MRSLAPGRSIRDTRKTLPGLRALQKYAVRVGGGQNHRMGLGDAALIKDNHVAAAGSVVAALRAVSAAAPGLPCEVEVDSLEQLDEVLAEQVRAGAARQLPGVADADGRAAAGHPRTRGEAGSPRGDCRWTTPTRTQRPGSTTWPSARSPTRCECSTSGWISSAIKARVCGVVCDTPGGGRLDLSRRRQAPAGASRR